MYPGGPVGVNTPSTRALRLPIPSTTEPRHRLTGPGQADPPGGTDVNERTEWVTYQRIWCPDLQAHLLVQKCDGKSRTIVERAR